MTHNIVNQILQAWISVDVLIYIEFVLGVGHRVGRDLADDLHHVGGGGLHVGIATGSHGAKDRGAKGRRIGHGSQRDGDIGDIGMDLHPEPALGGAAAGHDFLHRIAVAAQRPQDVLGAVGDALKDRTKEMARLVAQRQAIDDATRFRIDIGRAIALEVIEHD